MTEKVSPKITASNIVKSCLKGYQKIIPSKRLTDDREFVTLFMIHLRLKDHDADILITLNVPDKASNPQGYEEVIAYHTNVFDLINKSLEIKNLSLLFG